MTFEEWWTTQQVTANDDSVALTVKGLAQQAWIASRDSERATIKAAVNAAMLNSFVEDMQP